jgi:hypothetical protein
VEVANPGLRRRPNLENQGKEASHHWLGVLAPVEIPAMMKPLSGIKLMSSSPFLWCGLIMTWQVSVLNRTYDREAMQELSYQRLCNGETDVAAIRIVQVSAWPCSGRT